MVQHYFTGLKQNAKEDISLSHLQDLQAQSVRNLHSNQKNFYGAQFVEQILLFCLLNKLQARFHIPPAARSGFVKYSENYKFVSCRFRLHWFFKWASNMDTGLFRIEPCSIEFLPSLQDLESPSWATIKIWEFSSTLREYSSCQCLKDQDICTRYQGHSPTSKEGTSVASIDRRLHRQIVKSISM